MPAISDVSSATERARCATVTAVSEVLQLPELSFVRPLPGFGDLRRFVLVELPGAEGTLFELRSLEDPAVRFVAAVPTAFFPDYAFDLGEDDCAELGLSAEADALVLVLLTMGRDAAATTANLLAPVVVNARTRQAAQVILSGSDWPVRAAVA
jgi:flagellar assembly factor FliW